MREIVEAAYSIYVERIGARPGPMDDDYAALIDEGRVHVVDADPIPGIVVLIDGDRELVLHNVAVAPAFQGRGVGRALIAFAEAEARRHGRSRVLLYTHERMTENRALYASLGFRELERRDESGFQRVYMAKTLD